MSTKPIENTALAAEASHHFCSSPVCPFHIAADDPKVRGFGDWATLDNGTTVSHRWVNGRLLCDLCARPPQSLAHSAGPEAENAQFPLAADLGR